jgi:hypothetical protein
VKKLSVTIECASFDTGFESVSFNIKNYQNWEFLYIFVILNLKF